MRFCENTDTRWGPQKLVQAILSGGLQHRAVVSTFEDGYADNFYNARPLQEHYYIRAIVFVATGYVGHVREFRWDESKRVLLQPGTLPETLRQSVNGSASHRELGETADYSEDDYWHHHD